MDNEFKWFAWIMAIFFAISFGSLAFTEYLEHQRALACIEKGGTPANKTCVFPNIKP